MCGMGSVRPFPSRFRAWKRDSEESTGGMSQHFHPAIVLYGLAQENYLRAPILNQSLTISARFVFAAALHSLSRNDRPGQWTCPCPADTGSRSP